MMATTPIGMPGCMEKPSQTFWGTGVFFFDARRRRRAVGASHWLLSSISRHISDISQNPAGYRLSVPGGGTAALSQHFLASSRYLSFTPSISLSEFVSYRGAPVAPSPIAEQTKKSTHSTEK